jgi:hypothetical protein
MKGLNELTGLTEVKNEVRSLVAKLNIEQQRTLAGGEKVQFGRILCFRAIPEQEKLQWRALWPMCLNRLVYYRADI